MLQFILKDDFVYYEVSKNICSTFYIIANNTVFPDEVWYDLPISVLIMWNEILIKNNNKRRSKFKLFFMDGPFYIACCKEDHNVIMKFIHNNVSPVEKCMIEISFSDLKDSVYDCAARLIDFINLNDVGYLSGLDDLIRTTDILKGLLIK